MHKLFGLRGGTGDSKSNSPKTRGRNASKEELKDQKFNKKTALI